MNGIGNAYLDIRLDVDTDAVNYSSNIDLSVPTGDKDRGFSTGTVTADWTNYFSRSFSSVTPFGSIGIANTISDTSFFVRPFSSLGLVGHFEGGATVDVSDLFRVAASTYAVRASGEQRIISKLIERKTNNSSALRERRLAGRRNRVFEIETDTLVPADVANDYGFSTWFAVSPRSNVDFHVGYNRSVNYDFNSLFFGVGFRIGK